MTTELTMLLFSTLLFFAIIMVQALMAISQNGLPAQLGNRDGLPSPSPVRDRLQRLTANMQENLVMFTAIVLTAHGAGVSNEGTVLGASMFFYARAAHAVIYGFGLPYIRPFVWAIAVVGMALIVFELF